MNAAGKSILIIDPDKETSRQLSDVLLREGYYVTSASSGHEVLNNMQISHHLIILNPQLPDMNGLEFLRTIKQKPELLDVPVFVLST